jgi:hypothetical protein
LGDFGAVVEQMIRACDRQVELKNMPLDGVAEMVKPTDHQREALEQIRSAAVNASEALAAECFRSVSAGFRERLDTLSRTCNGGFARDFAPDVRQVLQFAQRRAKGASCSNDPVKGHCAPIGRKDSFSGKSGSGTAAWQFWRRFLLSAMGQVFEELANQADRVRTPLSDDQRATLYDLTATIYRAASKLGTRCHADDHFTPPGRLDAREEELKAWQQSVDSILPEALDLKTSSLIPRRRNFAEC